MNAGNKVHDGRELNLCNTVTFQEITKATLGSHLGLDLAVNFQCVAERGSHITRRNSFYFRERNETRLSAVSSANRLIAFCIIQMSLQC
jgi:hypothetical protein